MTDRVKVELAEAMEAVTQVVERVVDPAAPSKRRRRAPPEADKAGEKASEKPSEAAKEGEKLDGEAPPTKGGMLLVNKAVRDLLKSLPGSFNVGADYIPALNSFLCESIIASAGRAAANGRKTLRASDL